MDVNNSPTITRIGPGIARGDSLLCVPNHPVIGSSLRELYWLHSVPSGGLDLLTIAYMRPSHCQSTLSSLIVRCTCANTCYSTYKLLRNGEYVLQSPVRCVVGMMCAVFALQTALKWPNPVQVPTHWQVHGPFAHGVGLKCASLPVPGAIYPTRSPITCAGWGMVSTVWETKCVTTNRR